MYFRTNNTNVCSLLQLAEVGGLVVGGSGSLYAQNSLDDDDNPDEFSNTMPFETFLRHLRELCDSWDYEVSGSWSSWDTKYVPKMVIQAVTATPGQDIAGSYLERIGFQKSGPFSKLKHPETALIFWTMSGDDFCKSIGYVSKKDPRVNDQKAA